ncbi:hypothetical protein, partial [Nubsella zeaxanthinifaciens]|uniref:hypothetical protein n=1 Tax=Nubsella zeaxanthinifaciens TaxID=392412 RepID=UPI001BE0F26D
RISYFSLRLNFDAKFLEFYRKVRQSLSGRLFLELDPAVLSGSLIFLCGYVLSQSFGVFRKVRQSLSGRLFLELDLSVLSGSLIFLCV